MRLRCWNSCAIICVQAGASSRLREFPPRSRTPRAADGGGPRETTPTVRALRRQVERPQLQKNAPLGDRMRRISVSTSIGREMCSKPTRKRRARRPRPLRAVPWLGALEGQTVPVGVAHALLRAPARRRRWSVSVRLRSKPTSWRGRAFAGPPRSMMPSPQPMSATALSTAIGPRRRRSR